MGEEGKKTYTSVYHVCIFQNFCEQETILEIAKTATTRRIDILKFGKSAAGSNSSPLISAGPHKAYESMNTYLAVALMATKPFQLQSRYF